MWTSDTIHERLKAYEYELPFFMRDHHIPGLSIAMTNRHEVVYAKAYGARQLATNLPNTVETLHGIGSVSKSFTCFAVLQLAEQGKLSLEDPIKHYLDVSVDRDAHTPIRVRHLMSHTPTVSLGVTYAVVDTYECDDGRISPTRCAIIAAGLDGRWSPHRACRTPPVGACSTHSGLAGGSRRASPADLGGFPQSKTTRRSRTRPCGDASPAK